MNANTALDGHTTVIKMAERGGVPLNSKEKQEKDLWGNNLHAQRPTLRKVRWTLLIQQIPQEQKLIATTTPRQSRFFKKVLHFHLVFL